MGMCRGALLPTWSGFDPTATDACLAAMKQAQSEPDFCSTLGSAATVCDAVFASSPTSGSVPAGGPCQHSADCATPPGASASCFADPFDKNASPTCHQLLRGKAGDAPCSQEAYGGVTSSEGGHVPATSYTCQGFDGVYCNFKTSTCEPFLSTGQACDLNGDDCGPYATCRTAGYSADMTTLLTACVPNQGAGGRCEPTGTDPNFIPCDFRTTRCRASTQTCVAFLPAGSPCQSDDQCEGACKAGVCASYPEAHLCDTGGAAFHPRPRGQ
jgi:hypothetical protein